MDAKRKATLDELIGMPEESEEEKKNPDMLDLEEPKPKWILKTIIIIILFFAILGLAYTAYLSYTSTKKVSSEEKIENLASDGDTDTTSTTTKSEFVYVNADGGLNLRESANSTSKVVTTLPDKAKLTVLAEEGDWYKVSYNENTGYVSASFVVKTLESTPTPTP